MSQQPTGPPPPYPGGPPTYTEPGKDVGGFTGGYPGGYPGVVHPPHPYAWSGYGNLSQTTYSNPAQPGGGYSQPFGTQQYGPTSSGYTHNTTVVVSQPAVTVIQTFREAPVHTTCPHCRAEVVTGIHYETGTFTWVICFVLIIIGCGLGCCFIAFCLDGCKDVIHTCPNCQQQISRYSRM